MHPHTSGVVYQIMKFILHDIAKVTVTFADDVDTCQNEKEAMTILSRCCQAYFRRPIFYIKSIPFNHMKI